MAGAVSALVSWPPLWGGQHIFILKGQNELYLIITRAKTAPAMAIQSVIFCLFQPIPAIWSYLFLSRLFGAIQGYSELYIDIWSHLEPFGVIWSHLVPFGTIFS